jgi:hypothetical protein
MDTSLPQAQKERADDRDCEVFDTSNVPGRKSTVIED